MMNQKDVMYYNVHRRGVERLKYYPMLPSWNPLQAFFKVIPCFYIDLKPLDNFVETFFEIYPDI